MTPVASSSWPSPDVLVFYGGADGLALAESLVKSLGAIGCGAHTLVDLPSPPGGVSDKFEHYFAAARFYIVILTAGYGKGTPKIPKQEIIPEMTRCLTERPEDTLVLKEDGVVLPSTLSPVVWETFKRDAFHAVMPKVLAQLSERQLLRHKGTRAVGRKRAARDRQPAPTPVVLPPWLDEFIEQQESLWFYVDTAWGTVANSDRLLATHVLDKLDKLLTDYYYALIAVMNEMLSIIASSAQRGAPAGAFLKAPSPAVATWLRDCRKRCEGYLSDLCADILADLQDSAHKAVPNVERVAPDIRQDLQLGDDKVRQFRDRSSMQAKFTAFKDATTFYTRVTMKLREGQR